MTYPSASHTPSCHARARSHTLQLYIQGSSHAGSRVHGLLRRRRRGGDGCSLGAVVEGGLPPPLVEERAEGVGEARCVGAPPAVAPPAPDRAHHERLSACTPANKRLYARQALVRQALVRPRSLHAHTNYSYLMGVGTCGAAPLDTFLFLPFLPPALKCAGANSTNTVKLPFDGTAVVPVDRNKSDTGP